MPRFKRENPDSRCCPCFGMAYGYVDTLVPIKRRRPTYPPLLSNVSASNPFGFEVASATTLAGATARFVGVNHDINELILYHQVTGGFRYRRTHYPGTTSTAFWNEFSDAGQVANPVWVNYISAYERGWFVYYDGVFGSSTLYAASVDSGGNFINGPYRASDIGVSSDYSRCAIDSDGNLYSCAQTGNGSGAPPSLGRSQCYKNGAFFGWGAAPINGNYGNATTLDYNPCVWHDGSDLFVLGARKTLEPSGGDFLYPLESGIYRVDDAGGDATFETHLEDLHDELAGLSDVDYEQRPFEGFSLGFLSGQYGHYDPTGDRFFYSLIVETNSEKNIDLLGAYFTETLTEPSQPSCYYSAEPGVLF